MRAHDNSESCQNSGDISPVEGARAWLEHLTSLLDRRLSSCIDGGFPMKTQRLRDPIHGMIVFEEDDPLDQAAWDLLQTVEMQRLRRIKQLGVCEFVFPSATHSRFAHSMGVFHCARRLIKIVDREISQGRTAGAGRDEYRASVAMFASLLHDLGHGPFSHAFEEARKSMASANASSREKPKIKKHESFTADIIENEDGQVAAILRAARIDPKHVADLLRADAPTDVYHGVVSSSFDADRLDYLARDRYMTGVGAGAIDIEWLMDNVRVTELDVSPPENEGVDPDLRHSFCLLYKARDAAEDFLLARYRLYTNVYFHKAIRGLEQLIAAFFRLLSARAQANGYVMGLPSENPLVMFFSKDGETLRNYQALDDTVVWAAMHSIARYGDDEMKPIAQRILDRRRPLCIDLQLSFPEDSDRQLQLKRMLDERFKAKFGQSVFRDTAKLSIYGEIGADDASAHKRVMIRMADDSLREITDSRDAMIPRSDRQRPFERYYFLDEADHRIAEGAISAINSRRAR